MNFVTLSKSVFFEALETIGFLESDVLAALSGGKELHDDKPIHQNVKFP